VDLEGLSVGRGMPREATSAHYETTPSGKNAEPSVRTAAESLLLLRHHHARPEPFRAKLRDASSGGGCDNCLTPNRTSTVSSLSSDTGPLRRRSVSGELMPSPTTFILSKKMEKLSKWDSAKLWCPDQRRWMVGAVKQVKRKTVLIQFFGQCGEIPWTEWVDRSSPNLKIGGYGQPDGKDISDKLINGIGPPKNGAVTTHLPSGIAAVTPTFTDPKRDPHTSSAQDGTPNVIRASSGRQFSRRCKKPAGFFANDDAAMKRQFAELSSARDTKRKARTSRGAAAKSRRRPVQVPRHISNVTESNQIVDDSALDGDKFIARARKRAVASKGAWLSFIAS